MADKKIILSILLFGSVLNSGLHAEIIYLKSGKSVTGKVIAQDTSSVTILTENGKLLIQKMDIQRVFYASSAGQEERIRVDNMIEKMGDIDKSIAQIIEKRREEERQKQAEISKRADEEGLFFKDELEEIKKRKKRVAAQKSAFLPGWGQFYKGDSIRGWGIVGTGLFSVAGIYYGSKLYSKYKSGYNESNQIYLLAMVPLHSIPLALWNYKNTTEQRDKMQANISNAVTFGAVFVGIYLLNIGDAYFFDPDLSDETAGMSSPVGTGRFAINYEQQERRGDATSPGVAEESYSVAYSVPF